MSTNEYILGKPPQDERSLELFIQHAYGFSVIENMYNYAIEQLSKELSEKEKELAINSIKDTIYGLMMMHDGIPLGLRNEEYKLEIKTIVKIKRRGNNKETIGEVDLFNGDGMCMGIHGWLKGEFGEDQVALKK